MNLITALGVQISTGAVIGVIVAAVLVVACVVLGIVTKKKK